uniref:Uncharacterized protein n=1 Tax=Tanacetum cinerariifolium TaxID=118510 RepID=A0A699I4W1_TANCI|nr:hypothetical protein [Tanacetum cinerariifolium]
MVVDKPLDEQLMSKYVDTEPMDKWLHVVRMDKYLSNVVWDELIHIDETKMVKTVVETEDNCMKIDKC